MTVPINQIIHGDCIGVMKTFPENSIDCVVTDPPYGMSFMGKAWDKALPPVEAFEQMFRVLKPGALAFVMSSPRQDLLWRMLSMLEGVGFELTQSYIDWIYKTGFPKAYDVSKGIDSKYGKSKERLVVNKHSKLNSYKPVIMSPRPELNYSQNEIMTIKNILIDLFNKSDKPRSQIDLECGFRACNYLSLPRDGKQPDPWTHILPPFNKWLKIKEVIQYEDDGTKPLLNKWVSDSEKILIERGERPNSLEAGYGVGFTNFEKTEIKTTTPFTDLAKTWNGWKSQTGLKPAHEPILMVNKPFTESTIVDNVLKWGTGAINVDACRIPLDGEPPPIGSAKRVFKSNQYTDEKIYGENTTTPITGRFPSNLLVSDSALDNGTITKSGTLEPHHKINSSKTRNIYGEYNDQPPEEHTTYGDVGDQSRYFDLDVWAVGKGICDTPKPSRRERGEGNTHPTVKPVKLMAYLVELGCPPNGIVLDPFTGSGTTCIAAKQLRKKYIGIELNEEYVKIARGRVNPKGPLDKYSEFNEDSE